jgi:hypothetical protein
MVLFSLCPQVQNITQPIVVTCFSTAILIAVLKKKNLAKAKLLLCTAATQAQTNNYVPSKRPTCVLSLEQSLECPLLDLLLHSANDCLARCQLRTGTLATVMVGNIDLGPWNQISQNLIMPSS